MRKIVMGWVLVCQLVGMMGLLSCPSLAQSSDGNSSTSVRQEQKIVAENDLYRLEWDGKQGVFIRQAVGQQPEQKMPLVFLHTDLGPAGYSKYLAWFLAREGESFTLVWCYLNEAGKEFWCWLYRFPSNQMTTVHLHGDYAFSPLSEPTPASLSNTLSLHTLPTYSGADFTFRNWSRRLGTLPSLELHSALATGNKDAASSASTLRNLKVTPLHELAVGPKNGWRTDAWKELHALAYDAAQSPYYLILYSNSEKGFVVDLKQAQVFTANFGEKVRFAESSPSFGSKEGEFDEEPLPGVHRYEPYEMVVTSSHAYTNPYKEVTLDAEVVSPDGKPSTVLGFWDGGSTWRVRFTPTQVGTWTWRTHSNDASLNMQEGAFDCVAEVASVKGFVRVQPSYASPSHFCYADGTPFLPVMLAYSVHFSPSGSTAQGLLPQGPYTVLASTERVTQNPGANPAMFQDFQKFVDGCAAAGFNRWIGGYLLSEPEFSQKAPRNEGGSPFTTNGLEALNPAYFQWMDKRIAYCNTKGIVPDIGLGKFDQATMTKYSPEQLRRLWRYLLARYSSYHVCWNLFDGESGLVPSSVQEFAELTRLYDPYRHPLTLRTPNPPPAPLANTLPSTTPKPKRRKHDPVVVVETGTPLAGESWLDVITLAGGNLEGITADNHFRKPIVYQEAPSATSASLDSLRKRVWETRMRGGYWVANLDGGLNSPAVQLATECATLFGKTRFWRLQPHPEMLQGPQESPFEKRRRKKAEATEKAVPPTSDKKPPTGPIYVLADPSWEYVVYFTQGGSITLDLLEATGTVHFAWYNPRTHTSIQEGDMLGGDYRTFQAPDSEDWVLSLSRK